MIFDSSIPIYQCTCITVCTCVSALFLQLNRSFELMTSSICYENKSGDETGTDDERRTSPVMRLSLIAMLLFPANRKVLFFVKVHKSV